MSDRPPKTTVNVWADIDVAVNVDDVLRELDDDDLVAALERRAKNIAGQRAVTKLTLIYEEFRRRGDAPQILKDYLYEIIGRVL